MRTSLVIASASALALACASMPRTDGAADSAPAFAVRAAQMSAAEIEVSRMALDQAHEGRVRAFAQAEITEHGRALGGLVEIARVKGWRLPDGSDPGHRNLGAELVRLSGQEFDPAYMQIMVRDHVESVSLFRRYVRRGDDPELRAWARRTLRMLEAHADVAETTKEWVRPTSSGLR